MNSDSEKEK